MCLPVIRTATNLVRALCGMIFCLICGGPVCLAVGFVLLFSKDERADKVHEYNRDVKAFDVKAKESIELLIPAFINGAEAVQEAVDVVAVGYADGINPAKSERVVATASLSRSIPYRLNRTTPFIRNNVTEHETLYAVAFCNNGYGCSMTAMNNWCVIQYGSAATFIPKGGASSSSLSVVCPERGHCGQCQYTAYLTEYCVVLERMPPNVMRFDKLDVADVSESEKEKTEATGNGSNPATSIDLLIANSSKSSTVTDNTRSTHGRSSFGSEASSFKTSVEQRGSASTAPPVVTMMADARTTSATRPEGEEVGVGEEAGGLHNSTLLEEEVLFRPSVRFGSCYYPFSPSTQRYSSIRRPLYVLFPVLLDTDPFITMQRITEGTMNFGPDRATQRTAGVALVILGAVTLAVSMLLALILYRCYRHKRARDKYNEKRSRRDQQLQYAAEEGEASGGEFRVPPQFPNFFGQRSSFGQSWTANGHRASIGAYRSDSSEESLSSFSRQTSSPTPTNAPVASVGISEALGMGEVKRILNVSTADRRWRRQQEETRWKRRQRRGSSGHNRSPQHPRQATYSDSSSAEGEGEKESNPSFEDYARYDEGNYYHDGRGNGSRPRGEEEGSRQRKEAFGDTAFDREHYSGSFQPSVPPDKNENNERDHLSKRDSVAMKHHDPKDESLPTLRSCHGSSAASLSSDESRGGPPSQK